MVRSELVAIPGPCHKQAFLGTGYTSSRSTKSGLGKEGVLWMDGLSMVERGEKHECGMCRYCQCSQQSCTFKSLGEKLLIELDHTQRQACRAHVELGGFSQIQMNTPV
jgi:hypothetical protein